jgi:ferritin
MEMSPATTAALTKQANHELQSAQAYLGVAYWCDVHQFSGFAKYFHHQVEEERGHAAKLLKHLADRGDVPALSALTAPAMSFKHLTEVAQKVYDLERANTASIHATYEVTLAQKDYPAQVMLHWFINEQVEEEAWSEKLLAKTREATCVGALSSLDRHLTKILAGDDVGE